MRDDMRVSEFRLDEDFDRDEFVKAFKTYFEGGDAKDLEVVPDAILFYKGRVSLILLFARIRDVEGGDWVDNSNNISYTFERATCVAML
ncbi:MAG: hypothetical protein Q7R69_01035 [bacterium]|nr:hypothetical protein [bacterium]